MRGVFTIIALIFFNFCQAQNFDKIGEKDVFVFSGGLSENIVFNSSCGKPSNRDPFLSVTTGNLAFSILDINFPFSFTYSNKKLDYTQPFNRFQFAPQYKWLKLSIGDVSPSYSPYVLSGINCKGIELRLQPKVIQANLIYGRIQEANVPSFENDEVIPKTERLAYGTLLKKNGDNYSISLCGLYAFDKRVNPLFEISDPLQHNLAFNADYTLRIKAKTTLSFYAGGSRYALKNSEHLENNLDWLEWNLAYKAEIKRKEKKMEYGVQYEKIAPDYSTMGTYYFQNNLENISLFSAINLSKSLQLTSRIGIQRDNLDKKTSTNTIRNAINFNLNYSGKTIMLQSNYSNFTNVSRYNPVADLQSNFIIQDTNQRFQIQQSATLNVIYQKKSSNWQYNLCNQYSKSNQLLNENYKFINRSDTLAIQTLNNSLGINYKWKKNKHVIGLQGSQQLLFSQWMKTYNWSAGFKYQLKVSSKSNLAFQSNYLQKNANQSSSINRVSFNYSFNPVKDSKQSISIQSRISYQRGLKNQQLQEFLASLQIAYTF